MKTLGLCNQSGCPWLLFFSKNLFIYNTEKYSNRCKPDVVLQNGNSSILKVETGGMSLRPVWAIVETVPKKQNKNHQNLNFVRLLFPLTDNCNHLQFDVCPSKQPLPSALTYIHHPKT